MKLSFPELSLVVLIGPSGSGKSTFGARHFLRTEVLSSDVFRGLVADDCNDQGATADAFEALHFVAERRLRAGRLTVVDATSVRPEDRQPLVQIARRHHVLPVAIVFALPEELCLERNRTRPDRDFGPHVVRNQSRLMRRSMRHLSREGFRYVFVLRTPQEVDEAEVERTRLRSDHRDETGPFDIVGDVHGCYDELVELLGRLGYTEREAHGPDGEPLIVFAHPEGRRAIFVGDLVDRGPRSIDTVMLARAMTLAGTALCVPGNHDVRLVRKLRGRDMKLAHGLAGTMAELEALPPQERPEVERKVVAFLDSLVTHLVLDGGKLVVAHAGMRQEMQGRASAAVRAFALWGETTGETDELGLPVRYNWAADYRGRARVVYGHTPVPEPEWLNHTINIDTGCAFGGKLTALRYPELEMVSVPAARVHWELRRPLRPAHDAARPVLSAQQQHDELLDLDDVVGKRMVQTRLRGTVTVREENALAALEVMSRFATDPRWIVYLPPTMSPSGTSTLPGHLEHPAEAFAYYRQEGIPRVICQEKHMGSRAVLVVCRDHDAARRRFGVTNGEAGTCYSRTGRRFFDDPRLDAELVGAVRDAIGAAGWWDTLDTDWVCLDCELMPWSAKAQDLLRRQYAPVGAAARAGLAAAVAALEAASASGIDVGDLLEAHRSRADLATRYTAAYRRYCWPVEGVGDLRLAPFHLMASEGRVHADRTHDWHMARAAELAEGSQACGSSLAVPTASRETDLSDPASEAAATAWWEELTGAGGEGMVVKPMDFVARGTRGFVQPAVKVRGVEYLRIIYGPTYTEEGHLERLRTRGLGAKRSLAMRELALGLEALHRFVEAEPLRRVHECVFAVLALESEPVDPRL